MPDAVTLPDHLRQSLPGDPGEVVLHEIGGTPFLFPRRIEERVAHVLRGKYDFGILPDCQKARRILDVGAGVGEFACWAWRRWRGGAWIECYETDPALLPFLRHNLPPGAAVHPVSIKDAKAAATLPPCDVLKLETGGSEVEVLQGYAHRPSVVCVEWHREQDRLQVENLLSSWGLRCFRLAFKHPGFGYEVWARSDANWSDDKKAYMLP